MPFSMNFLKCGDIFFQMTAYFSSFMATVDNMDIYVTIYQFRLKKVKSYTLLFALIDSLSQVYKLSVSI